MLRFRSEGEAHRDGRRFPDQGGDLLTIGATLAFRPQPALDFQLSAELPLYERVNGVQLGTDFTVLLAFGYRI
jgi:hypothetical protein